MLEFTGRAVKILVEAMAAFKKLEHLLIWWDVEAWAEEDWREVAGIDRQSSMTLESDVSGKTNIAVVTNKVLAAIAQATLLRQGKFKQFRLKTFWVGERGAQVVDGHVTSFFPNLRHKQDIKLQDITILNYQALLQAAFSQLNVLRIDVDPLAKTLDAQRDMPKIEAALRILLGSDRIAYL